MVIQKFKRVEYMVFCNIFLRPFCDGKGLEIESDGGFVLYCVRKIGFSNFGFPYKKFFISKQKIKILKFPIEFSKSKALWLVS